MGTQIEIKFLKSCESFFEKISGFYDDWLKTWIWRTLGHVTDIAFNCKRIKKNRIRRTERGRGRETERDIERQKEAEKETAKKPQDPERDRNQGFESGNT